MDLKNLFNSYLSHGINVRLSGLNGKEEWDKKISKQDNSLNEISGGWITPRIFYDGTKSTNSNDIYDYLYNRLGMKGEKTDSSISNFEQYHFILQTARLVKLNSCNVERLAQIGYNVGQMLACIDFYCAHPAALQYISINKLNLVESYINLQANVPSSVNPANQSQLVGGTAPVIDFYKKYIDLTPYKGSKLFGGSCDSTKTCKCGESNCDSCVGSAIINLI